MSDGVQMEEIKLKVTGKTNEEVGIIMRVFSENDFWTRIEQEPVNGMIPDEKDTFLIAKRV